MAFVVIAGLQTGDSTWACCLAQRCVRYAPSGVPHLQSSNHTRLASLAASATLVDVVGSSCQRKISSAESEPQHSCKAASDRIAFSGKQVHPMPPEQAALAASTMNL